MIVLAVLIYSAQVSVGIFIMFLVKKPVIAIALYYVVLLLLGSVLSPNEFTKNSIGYTPFGIDDTQLLSDFEIMNVIEPISTGVFYFNVHFFIDIIISKL